MAKKRPIGFVRMEKVLEVIENSINGVIDWSNQTNEAFFDMEKRLELLHELEDIVVELSWRYGNENVVYMFSQKRNIPGAVKIDSIESEYWADRILVDESMTEMSKVYIRF